MKNNILEDKIAEKKNFFFFNLIIFIVKIQIRVHFYIVVIENCMNARGQKSPVDWGRNVAGL